MENFYVGLVLLTRPTPTTTKNIVQETTVGDGRKLVGVGKEAIDRDSDKFFEYQVEMKQYVSDKTRYKYDLQNYFNVILGQCSPAVLQNLESEDAYDDVKKLQILLNW